MFETLLLNFLFLLFPVVIFLIFFESTTYSYNINMIVVLSAVAMSLCIIKPIKLDMGYIFDLRYIPFIIVALFGGYRRVLPLYFILNIARIFVGGDGTLRSFLFSTAVMLIVPLLSRKFLKLHPKGRVLSATVISVTVIGLYLVILSCSQEILDRQFWFLTLDALTTHAGVTSILMLLIEKIIVNIENRDKMMQSERLNVVSELAASVSHEIRNPLAVTSGFLQLLNKSRTITPKEQEYVALSLQELTRAEKIVSDYLSFAKPQSANVIYSNMSEEFEYTKNIIIPYASIHKVQVEFSFNNSLKKSYDRNQLQQCLINLYKNGIESMKEKGGGVLFIDISERKQDIIIRIQDTGIGMTPEEISRLGRPYYSTKEEGTGLGMLMVYSTVNKVKGCIEVDSVKGKGTTFLITIPT